ncbi:MAG TPA: primosomal protein N' [Leptolyngbyaceae cyanobacterium M65_K2018_010]|nr:primosomal protein N' [Leptolyngbyaceae cyanobacterium M65_K2018_010]
MVKPSSPQQTDKPGWVNALVDYGGQPEIYTYRVPDDLEVQAGDILTVPFRQQQVGAIAIALLASPPQLLHPEQIRPIEGIVEKRFFSSSYWALLQRVAEYYQTPLVQVLKAALPPGLLARSQRRLRLCPERLPAQINTQITPAVLNLLNTLRQSTTGDYAWPYLQRQGHSYRAMQKLIQLGWAESYLAAPQFSKPQRQQAVTVVSNPGGTSPELTPRQAEILTTLRHHGGDLWLSEALQLCKTSSATLKRLVASGHLVIEARERLRAEAGPTLAADQPKALTPDQAKVVTVINSCDRARQILLHGVTGSGKTEIYLQAIAPRLAAGQSALVLVPEIGLTPQLTDRFRRRFGPQVCVYHSGLADGERYDAWRQSLHRQNPLVMIGTRSAVFLPLRDLGLIILDEEHDSSYKQDVPPCYHARTVARWRASLENCPLILGSATPSLTTWVECRDLSPAPPQGLPTIYLSLPKRVHARPLPTVQVIDMREELHQGNRSILSRHLQTALQEMKRQGNQGLLFIHRRGHSSFVSCRSCGYVIMCPHCDVSLSYHQPHAHSAMTLRCHYCGYSQGHPHHCPECGSPYLKHFGSGTQRVVNALAETLPELSCLRFAGGEADLLVGTQMLTKGIDLPQVTLVGIMAADGLLYMNDYWAGERALQMLIQVAGRAGRGEQPGEVILQTYTPEHPVIAAVTRHDYETFLAPEWAQRQLLQYPPASQLVLLRLGSTDPDLVPQVAMTLADKLKLLLQGIPHSLLGPAPAPIVRVARRYRWHILLKFPLGIALPDLQGLRAVCPATVSLTIDVDPLNLT